MNHVIITHGTRHGSVSVETWNDRRECYREFSDISDSSAGRVKKLSNDWIEKKGDVDIDIDDGILTVTVWEE